MANPAWSLAKLVVRNSPLIQAISAEARPRISAFFMQNISNTVWAYAKLGLDDAPLLDALAPAAINLI